MANQVGKLQTLTGGISTISKKLGPPNSFAWGRSIDFRSDPAQQTTYPRTTKISGSIVTDLPMFGAVAHDANAVIADQTNTLFFHGNTGNIYAIDESDVVTKEYTVPSSSGNGIVYFSETNQVYIPTNNSITRRDMTTGNYYDYFLETSGGTPTNLDALKLIAASSQSATRADTASLSITGDMTLEAYLKPTSLPTSTNQMAIISKWDESGSKLSYKLSIITTSAAFGSGSDGSLTISSNTTDAPIDSACTGTAGSYSLTATNTSFAASQEVFIHQSQGTNAGQCERGTIQSYTAGTITLTNPLVGTYTTGAQVLVLKQYTNVTVNSGKTLTAKAWNGTVGGILAFLANGTVTVTGNITANGGSASTSSIGSGGGFRGGVGIAAGEGSAGYTGEGTGGASTLSQSPNGNGGGSGGGGNGDRGGGGGSNSTKGTNGTGDDGEPGVPGNISGTADLTTMTFGGGGAGGRSDDHTSGAGGNGGGILFLAAVTITVTGAVTANGGNGDTGVPGPPDVATGSGAGAAGGSILFKAQTATLGSGLVTATGGTGGVDGRSNGGDGGAGYVVIDYLTSQTGTTTPTLNPIQDPTLGNGVGYQARLGISNDGTASEYLTMTLPNLTTGVWYRLSIAWHASISTATFYLNGVSLGTSVGSKTSISNNVSLLYVGANKGASVVQNYFDGLLNDMRIWANLQTSSQIFANLQQHVSTVSTGLSANYYFNSAATDATANANDLTLVNTPTYSTDVPFAGLTTRQDLDVLQNLTGNTYTLLTAISEASADTLAYTPVTDPQASVGFYISAVGTGNVTVTVHDQQNRVIDTATITHANLPSSGFVEFIYPTPWRITAGAKYHMHLTVSTGTTTIVTGTSDQFSTAEYSTYFQYLVTDTQFHPLIQFQYQPLGGTLTGAIIIGNERYIGVWDGVNYVPNFIQFPPGWHVRCFGFWRQYLAIGMWRGGKITDFDKGRVYFWTGYQPAFDFFIDVPEGQINALFGVDSDLYMFAGYRGILLDYKGGFFYNTGNSSSNKLKRMPLLSQADYTEVYPGALTMWRGLLHFGLYANSNSTTVQRGTYSFGALNQWYADTLSYDYVISTGSLGSTATIGLVYSVGQNLIVGWQDGIAYGADVINFSNPPAPSGELQTLILDNKAIWKIKENLMLGATFLPLKAGESIDLKQNVNRTGFIVTPTDATVGDIYSNIAIVEGRSREIQFGVDLYATGTTSPTLIGVSLLQNPLQEEDQFNG